MRKGWWNGSPDEQYQTHKEILRCLSLGAQLVLLILFHPFWKKINQFNAIHLCSRNNSSLFLVFYLVVIHFVVFRLSSSSRLPSSKSWSSTRPCKVIFLGETLIFPGICSSPPTSIKFRVRLSFWVINLGVRNRTLNDYVTGEYYELSLLDESVRFWKGLVGCIPLDVACSVTKIPCAMQCEVEKVQNRISRLNPWYGEINFFFVEDISEKSSTRFSSSR